MTEWNPLYLSHIGRVRADFTLSSPDLDPDEITHRLSMQPGSSSRRGEPRINAKGEPTGTTEKDSWWQINSQNVESKDINVHIQSLLELLLPHEQEISRLVEQDRVESYFGVLWESSYLYAGTGPILEEASISGIARLKASIGFDIYQIDSDDSDDE